MEAAPVGLEKINSDGDATTISSSSCFISSTNWIVAHGSLQDAISYDCSSSLFSSANSDDGDGNSTGLLLLKPPSQGSAPESESAPCEITICFRERHEIHRVYVRSTARVYEIHYTPKGPCKNDEYLFTVRCGVAEREVVLPEIDAGLLATDSRRCPSQIIDVPENDSSNNSDEDGWIELKIPNSPLLDDRMNSMSKIVDRNVTSYVQSCYEATAEISDASPCISLTLRLLSLQPKECVYIEDIYIYADPVELESPDSGPSACLGGNIAGSSLLAMLVPGLLQLSKNGNSRIPGKDVLESSDRKADTVESNPEIVERTDEEKCSGMPNSVKGDEQIPIEVTVVKAHLDSYQQMPVSSVAGNSVHEQDNISYSHVGKVLDELVSRVGRIESFCLRFEENMMKPLCSIETRLQKLEEQLGALTVSGHCPAPFPSTRISAPEFHCAESDSESFESEIERKGYHATDNLVQNIRSDKPSFPADHLTPPVLSETPGVTITSPEHLQCGDPLINCNDHLDSAKKRCSEDMESFCDTHRLPSDNDGNAICNKDFESAEKSCAEDKPSIFRAPEFPHIDDSVGCNNASVSTGKSCPKDKAPLSVDTALASALKAFMSSAIDKHCEDKAISGAFEQSNEGENKDQSVESPGVLCEEADSSGVHNFENNQEHNISDSVSCISSTEERTEEDGYFKECCISTVGTANETPKQDQFHMQWPQDTCDNLLVEANGPNWVKRELTEDIGVGEAAQEVSSKDVIYNSLYDSMDSSVEEGIILDQCGVDWSDGSSTDSGDVAFALRSWLSGLQGHHRSNEEAVDGTASSRIITDLIKDSASHDYGKSKIEIERALNSELECEDSILSVKFSCNETQYGMSFLVDLLAETHDIKENDNSGIEVREQNSLSQNNEGSNSFLLDLNSSLNENRDLVDVGEFYVTGKASYVEEELQIPFVSSNQLSFSSLI